MPMRPNTTCINAPTNDATGMLDLGRRLGLASCGQGCLHNCVLLLPLLALKAHYPGAEALDRHVKLVGGFIGIIAVALL